MTLDKLSISKKYYSQHFLQINATFYMIKLTLDKITFLPTIFKYLHIEKKNNTHLYTFKIFDNLPQILLSTKVNTLLKPSLDKTIRNFSLEFLTSKVNEKNDTHRIRSILEYSIPSRFTYISSPS